MGYLCLSVSEDNDVNKLEYKGDEIFIHKQIDGYRKMDKPHLQMSLVPKNPHIASIQYIMYILHVCTSIP